MPEGGKFLGVALSWRRGRGGNHYPHLEPHPKSLKKLREKLNRTTLWRSEELIPEINRQLKGWKGYFYYGNSTQVFGRAQARITRCLWT